MVNRSDVAVAAVLLGLCGALWYHSASFEEVSPMFAQDVPPEMFPRMLLVFIGALALVIPIERFLRGEGGKVLDKARSRPIQPIAYITAAYLLGALLLITWSGTLITLLLVCAGLPLLWGERRVKLLLAYVVIFPALVLGVFSFVLGVQFEPGILGLSFN